DVSGGLRSLDRTTGRSKEVFNTAKSIYYLEKDSISNLLFLSSVGFACLDAETYKPYDEKKGFAMKEIIRLDEKYFAFAHSAGLGLFRNPKVNSGSIRTR